MHEEKSKLLDEVGDVILSIDPYVSGPTAAARGCTGLKLLNSLHDLILRTDPEWKAMPWAVVMERYFDCLVNDYRITRAQMEELKFAYVVMRRMDGSGVHAELF